LGTVKTVTLFPAMDRGREIPVMRRMNASALFPLARGHAAKSSDVGRLSARFPASRKTRLAQSNDARSLTLSRWRMTRHATSTQRSGANVGSRGGGGGGGSFARARRLWRFPIASERGEVRAPSFLGGVQKEDSHTAVAARVSGSFQTSRLVVVVVLLRLLPRPVGIL
jgi:hypothetical protein